MFLTVYYPRRTKPMGATGKKISSFLLTQYTGNYLEIFLNNIIKMWEQFRILEFVFIIWLILIEQIFLISSSDLVSMLSTTAGLTDVDVYPFLFAAIIPIKSYSNAEDEKAQILKDNKNKSGIYMWENKINGKRYRFCSRSLKKAFFLLFYCLYGRCIKKRY